MSGGTYLVYTGGTCTVCLGGTYIVYTCGTCTVCIGVLPQLDIIRLMIL